MSWLQTLFLAFIQGLTEFLPISSSAHLLLPKILLGWPDQGLALDVALHVGTLVAVITYLRTDLARMLGACWRFARGRSFDSDLRLLGLLAVATLPLIPAGLSIAPAIAEYRTAPVIALTTIFFGVLLWWADRHSGRRDVGQLDWREALLIGVAQTFALIPGTSRSGVTMTAALALGLDRVSAARFSFLLSIPAILASGTHQLVELEQSTEPVPWLRLSVAAATAGAFALIAMHGLLAWLQRSTMQAFVVYRLALGLLLVLLILSG